MNPKWRLFLLLVVSSVYASAIAGVEEARALFKSGMYVEARNAYSELLKINPQNAEAAYFLGRLAVMHDGAKDGIPYLEKAVMLDPTNSTYTLWLGNAYGAAALKASWFEQASLATKSRRAYEKAVELAPEDIDARMALLGYYRQAPGIVGGSMEKAYAQADEIRKRDAIRGNIALADLKATQKKYAEAFALYAESLKTNPDHYPTLYFCGRLAAISGQNLERGAECLHRCLDLTPGENDASHAVVFWRLGNIAEKQNDVSAARKAYEEALKLDPDLKQAQAGLDRVK